MATELSNALRKHGPWAALASVLLGVFLYEVRPSMAAIVRQHDEMRAEVAANELKHATTEAQRDELLRKVLESLQRSTYLEFRNCLNTARSADQMDRCAYKD